MQTARLLTIAGKVFNLLSSYDRAHALMIKGMC